MLSRSCICRAQSCAKDAREAVREFHAAVAQPDMALVVFFCSSAYDLDVLADEMHRLFAGVPVIGCTTAGEIGPAGYLEHTLSGASFPSSNFEVACGCLENLQQFDHSGGRACATNLLQNLNARHPALNPDTCFAWLLIDGLSVREEPVARLLQSTLGQIPLFGGSAGDGKQFGRAFVYFDGRFRTDSAVLTLVSTPLPFRLFKTQGIIATEERLVVTEADPARRIVKELNGLPATQEYARVLGLNVGDLCDELFMRRPVVVLINGIGYARSIQRAYPDGSLQLFCAIENGLVLRVARCDGMLENLEQALAQVNAEIGAPQIVLGSDCLHRKLEMEHSPDRQRIEKILLCSNVTGFGTYGEQFRGVHVNQTFVGLAIGEAKTVNAHA